ncbi:MAG: GNAT family N-acetyltransferase [Bacteroidetes bacterium]|nr:GNAT family N-acetyltransferase [Bacteroidota bacterium]
MADIKFYIETDRLILREFQLTDDVGMFELDSDPEVHKYLGNKPVETIDECRTTIESVLNQYIENGIGRWAIIEKLSGNFVGWAGLKLMKTTINNHIDFYDSGYRLIQKYWGKGYATEATKASLQYGFRQMNLKEIYGITHIENLKSRRVLEKSGLRFIEHFIWPEWHNIKCNWLKITKEEWEDKFLSQSFS